MWQLCGRETRNTCTAGYKAIRQDGRYPSREYLAALDERFAGFVEDKIEHPLSDLGARAGDLTAEAAGWTGLPGASRSPSATSTRTSPRRPRARSSRARCSP